MSICHKQFVSLFRQAASAYVNAKIIIKLINNVGKAIRIFPGEAQGLSDSDHVPMQSTDFIFI